MADTINETLENLRAAIEEFTEKSGSCCASGGSKVGAVPVSDPPEYGGIDDQYPDAESYFDARCNACNGIYDTILEFVDWLDSNNVDLKAGIFGGLTTGITFALIGTGPAGWAIMASGVVVTSLAVWLIQEAFDFDALSTGFGSVHSDLVGALYNAQDVPTARANFLTVLAGATPTPSASELYLIELCLTEDVLNNIFNPRSDLGSYLSAAPIDCGGVTLQVWPFIATGEGWTFRDDSDGTYSASGVHVPARQAWEITIVGLGTGSGPKAMGTIFITGLSIAVDAGNSVQMDFGPLGDGVNASKHIKVIFSDLTELETSVPGSTSGTVILSMVATKTIAEIECWVQRNWSNAFNTTVDFREVRVQ